MDSLFVQEKKKIEQNYLRTKGWFEGELQSSYRLSSGITDWCGYTFWRDCYDAELKALQEKYEKQLCHKIGKNIEDKHMWVGVNPEFPDILSLYKSFINSRVLKNYKYQAVIEGHTKNGYRPHIHMIIYTEERPNRVIDKLSKVFNCGKNFVDCKTSYELQAHLKYISGIKREDKQDLVEEDVTERDKFGIPHILNN